MVFEAIDGSAGVRLRRQQGVANSGIGRAEIILVPDLQDKFIESFALWVHDKRFALSGELPLHGPSRTACLTASLYNKRVAIIA